MKKGLTSLFILLLCMAAPPQSVKGQSFYDFSIVEQSGDTLSLENFRGMVVLVVNTASQCGFTPQYADLERIYEKYSMQGFEILDFPCNQFGGQSPESDEETTRFCQLNYGTKFPQRREIEVNGENEIPLYTWLKSQKEFAGFDKSHQLGSLLDNMLRKANPDYDKNPDIKWNFTKFLIDRHGNVIRRFEPTEDMTAVDMAIAELM